MFVSLVFFGACIYEHSCVGCKKLGSRIKRRIVVREKCPMKTEIENVRRKHFSSISYSSRDRHHIQTMYIMVKTTDIDTVADKCIESEPRVT